MGQQHFTITENFLRYFDVALAVSKEQKSEVFGIRYSVYCDEFQYEPAHLFPNHEEKDEFDATSLHALVTHKATGLPAGCVRVVMTTGVDGSDKLPFEVNCADSLDMAYIDSLNVDRTTMCEISRLAVDSAFRRRAGEKVTRFGEVDGLDCTQQERRTFSLIAVACFLAATSLTKLTGRTNAFAMMEPFLPRLLKRSGIFWQRAGQDIDYHGLRAPYFNTTESVLEGIRPDLKELFVEIENRIEKDYLSKTW